MHPAVETDASPCSSVCEMNDDPPVSCPDGEVMRGEYELGRPSMRLRTGDGAEDEPRQPFRHGARRMARQRCIRRIGPVEGTPEPRLWWRLRTTNFTRERVEHIVATIRRWEGHFPYSLFKVYKRRYLPKRDRAYWYAIRQLLVAFGGTKPANKNETGDTGRFFLHVLGAGDGDDDGEGTGTGTGDAPPVDLSEAGRRLTKAVVDQHIGAFRNFQLRVVMPVNDPEEGVVERTFIVIPAEDAGQVVASVYADPSLAAFHGRDRVYKLLTSRFVGINRNMVVDTIRRHEASQVTFNSHPTAMRVPGQLVRRPNHVWQADFTGHTYGSDQRLRSVILVVVDCFSRYVWARLLTGAEYRSDLSGMSAKRRIIEELFLTEGAPEVLQTDNEFASLRDLCKKHDVRLRISKPHHWKAQSTVERFNKLLKDKVRLSEADRDRRRSKLLVREVASSMNHLASAVLGNLTPFEVFRGRQPRHVASRLDRHLRSHGFGPSTGDEDEGGGDEEEEEGGNEGGDDGYDEDEDEDEGENEGGNAGGDVRPPTPPPPPPVVSGKEKRVWFGGKGQAWMFKKGNYAPGFYTEPSDGRRNPTIIKVVRRFRRDDRRFYEYSVLTPSGWSAARGRADAYTFTNTATEFLENIVQIMKLRLGVPVEDVRLTKRFVQSARSVLAVTRRFERLLARQNMEADASSPVHTLLAFRLRWSETLGRAIDRDAALSSEADAPAVNSRDEVNQVGFGTRAAGQTGGGKEEVRAYRDTRNASALATTKRVLRRALRGRRLVRARSHAMLDKRQGAIAPFTVVRLLQAVRDDPTDEYARRAPAVVGTVYRRREKGRLSALADRDRTDPYRLRDKWSLELFLVTRVVYNRAHLRHRPGEDEDEDADEDERNRSQPPDVVDQSSLPPALRETLLRRGHVPRYMVRRIDLLASAGSEVDLEALRIDAAERVLLDGEGRRTYPHYRLGPEHTAIYHRRDLLRIPQDRVHRFDSSLTSLPRTQRT